MMIDPPMLLSTLLDMASQIVQQDRLIAIKVQCRASLDTLGFQMIKQSAHV